MNITPPKWPQSYLDQDRKVFGPHYGGKLTDERVINIANSLYGYAVICYDSWEKRLKKEQVRI